MLETKSLYHVWNCISIVHQLFQHFFFGVSLTSFNLPRDQTVVYQFVTMLQYCCSFLVDCWFLIISLIIPSRLEVSIFNPEALKEKLISKNRKSFFFDRPNRTFCRTIAIVSGYANSMSSILWNSWYVKHTSAGYVRAIASGAYSRIAIARSIRYHHNRWTMDRCISNCYSRSFSNAIISDSGNASIFLQ